MEQPNFCTRMDSCLNSLPDACKMHLRCLTSVIIAGPIPLSLGRTGHCVIKGFSFCYPNLIPRAERHNLCFHLVVKHTNGAMTASCSCLLSGKNTQVSSALPTACGIRSRLSSAESWGTL